MLLWFAQSLTFLAVLGFTVTAPHVSIPLLQAPNLHANKQLDKLLLIEANKTYQDLIKLVWPKAESQDSMFVGVVALRYQHRTTLCGFDNGVTHLPQTWSEFFDYKKLYENTSN